MTLLEPKSPKYAVALSLARDGREVLELIPNVSVYDRDPHPAAPDQTQRMSISVDLNNGYSTGATPDSILLIQDGFCVGVFPSVEHSWNEVPNVFFAKCLAVRDWWVVDALTLDRRLAVTVPGDGSTLGGVQNPNRPQIVGGEDFKRLYTHVAGDLYYAFT